MEHIAKTEINGIFSAIKEDFNSTILVKADIIDTKTVELKAFDYEFGQRKKVTKRLKQFGLVREGEIPLRGNEEGVRSKKSKTLKMLSCILCGLIGPT